MHADLEEKYMKLCIFAFVKVKNQEITKVKDNYQIHKQTIYKNFIYARDQTDFHFKIWKFR